MYQKIIAELLREGKPVRLAVVGNSMSPTLKNGDMVTIIPSKNFQKNIKNKIAMVLRPNGRLLLHRIVLVENGRIITRADQEKKNDEPVVFDNLLGVVGKIHINPAVFLLRKIHLIASRFKNILFRP